MSFVDRTFPDIVRDVLTTLTGGISGESHVISTNPDGSLADIHLQRRPVTRVSEVSGFVAVPDADPKPVVFGLDDYALVTDPADPTDVSTLRFLASGRIPAAGTAVTVNYYPRSAEPTVVQDVAVGSVVRTLVEAVAREIALAYGQLNAAYDSAFVETATGSSLDRVVALLGFRRFRAGRPVGTVRFSRRTGVVGEVTIPAGTPVADAKDTLRYETTETRTMLAGESTAQIQVRGASAATPVVEVGVLTSIQRAIAGIDTVTNERPTSTASQDETDAELRTRARAALTSAAKGTVPALTNGLLALPEVRAVNVAERPDDVPGEIRVSLSLASPPADGSIPAAVLDRVEDLRPAGIRVVLRKADELVLVAGVRLVLAGSSLPSVELEQLHQSVRSTLVDLLARVQVGQRVRTGALQASLVDGERVLDASVTIGSAQGPPAVAGADVVPAAGQSVRLSPADVSFLGDEFDAPPSTAQLVTVEVRATVRATAVAQPTHPDVRSELTTRLAAYVATLTPGTVVTGDALLGALREDTSYAVDPLGLVVTFSAGDQFVQVAPAGPSYTVSGGQRFTVSSVELTP